VKKSLTAQSLIALVLGVAIGLLLARSYPAAIPNGLIVADDAIRIWTNAFRLMVAPLVVSQLFYSITDYQASKGEAARLAVSILAVFVGLLVFIAAASTLVTLGFLELPFFRGLAFPDLGNAMSPAQSTVAATARSWIDNVFPSNLVDAAARPEAILGLMLFTIAFARAARRISDPLEQSLKNLAQAVRDATFIIVGWLVRLAPLLLLALGFRSSVDTGLDVGRMLLVYIVIESIACVTCTALLYPLSSLGGRVSLARFARAVFPAQVVAATTRSSLATVPLLLRDAGGGLGLPARTSGLVIPLAGATLKLSRTVSSPLRLIFIAHFLGLSFSIEQILVFIITIIALNPLTLGVPSVFSGTGSLPAFVAAGVPAEYVLLLGATTWVVDIFLTVINSTGYMAAAVLVSRLLARRPPPNHSNAPTLPDVGPATAG